jgi:hypothetical protein
MIYTDKTHLVADTLAELLAFGRAMGLRPEWIQGWDRSRPRADQWPIRHSNRSKVIYIVFKPTTERSPKMPRTIEQIIRDWFYNNPGRQISMYGLVSLCGGRWSANQRLNKMIRRGSIGLLLKKMVTPNYMALRLIRRRPLYCPVCRKYTHISINEDRTINCEGKNGAGGTRCGHDLNMKLSKNGKLLHLPKR